MSCTYLVYDAWSRTLSFADAGHDAPLLITGHEVGQMEIEHKGLLLGVRGKGIPGLPTYREETRYLAPGSTLVFYTDGLTDRRQRADGTGHYTEAEALQMLRQAVQDVATGTVEAIAQAAEQAVPGGNRRRHGDRRRAHLHRGARLPGAQLPGRADPGFRGPAAGPSDVHQLGHGP